MKKMGFILTVFCMSISILVEAQPRGPREKLSPEQQAAQRVEHLHQELQLTDKQQQELKLWFTKALTERETEMQKHRNNREEARKIFKKSQEAADAELKKVLTVAQYKKYQALETKRQQERQQQRERRPGPR